jgi:D-alanyl-D-alanine carboxypeptidase
VQAPFPTARFAALTERTVSTARAAQLQAALARAAGRSGMTATVMSAEGSWTGAVGHAGGRTWMRPDSQMAIGSVTKSLVAAQVMQLVEAGELSLDDPADEHLPAWVRLDTNHATIRDLLGMRSGLADFVGAGASHSPDLRQGDTWAEALARAGSPRGPAGPYFEYSNTNYLLLGIVVEEVRGRSLAKVMRQGVLAGEGLGRLVFQPEERPTAPMAMPSAQADALVKGGGYLPSFQAISGAGGAGAMASDAATLARWWARFCAGKVVSQASLDQMSGFRVGADEYGLGLMDEHGMRRPAIGHEGLQVGFASWAACLYDDGLVITVLANSETDTQPALEALADVAAAWS